MIVTAVDDRWRLITQPDHARFSAELLRTWRRADLADHPRRDDVLFAAREHDNGWREADAAPSWDRAGGRPHSFLTLPPARRLEIWERSTARFAEQRPWASLLITLHALSFVQPRGADARDAFVERLEERRDALLEATGGDAETAAADYRFVRLADAASLLLCGVEGVTVEAELPGGAVRGRRHPRAGDGPPTLLLDPLPLAGATTFRIPARCVPRRRYAGDAELGGELAAARWEELAVRVAAG